MHPPNIRAIRKIHVSGFVRTNANNTTIPMNTPIIKPTKKYKIMNNRHVPNIIPIALLKIPVIICKHIIITPTVRNKKNKASYSLTDVSISETDFEY